MYAVAGVTQTAYVFTGISEMAAFHEQDLGLVAHSDLNLKQSDLPLN